MTVFWVLLGIAILGGVAAVAAGRGDGLEPHNPDRPDVSLPADRPVVREDIDRLRFSVGFRGYRMDEVDDVLDRVAADLAHRDQLIGQLLEQLGGQPADAAEAASVREGAALLPPAIDRDPDLATARTLLVPLEQMPGPGRSEDPSGAPAPTEEPDA